MVCSACGVDLIARIHQLEKENEFLRTQLAEANKVIAQADGKVAPAQAVQESGHSVSSLLQTVGAASMDNYVTCAQGSWCSVSSFSQPIGGFAIQRSPAQLHAIRGYTEAGLAEAEAAEESLHGELEVSVGDAPRRCPEATGACTVVQVRTIDRPGLLAQISAVLAGVDLTIARAFFRTSEQGVVSNEFWVQQTGTDGRLGPIIEGVKRRAIEQRIRQWSAGQRMELRAQHVASGHASSDLSELLKLPSWQGATELPPHSDTDDIEHRQAFIRALTAALTTDCSWLGALPPVLARQTATALLPRLHRVHVPAGAKIERNRPDQLGTDFLLLLEDPMPVMCGLASEDDGASTSPIDLAACSSQTHPTGSVLCLSSTMEVKGRQLAWHSVDAPSGGVIGLLGRAALRELLGDTRKAAVRRHANQLASAAYFEPLGTPQLLALCHRAVEVSAAPMSRVDTLGSGPAQLARHNSVSGAAAVAVRANSAISLPDDRAPSFMIVLSGSAVVAYRPPAGSAASDAAALQQDGCVPIHRLRANDHYGAIEVLRNRVDPDLRLYAGEEGCTLLRWASDEFLQRELKKLPELLSSCWAAHSPLALATSMPRIITLLQPISLDEMRAHAVEQRGSDRAAAGVIAPKAALCVLLSGQLYEEAAAAVTIEAPSDDVEPAAAPAASYAGGEIDERAGSRHLIVRVEIPSRGAKLQQIAGLLAELQLDVTSGSVATNGGLTKDTFHVRYRGTLSPSALAATLRAKLRDSLQLSAIVPGDTIEASRTRPFTIHATASGATTPDDVATGKAAADGTGAGRADVRLGFLDLRAFAAAVATPESPDSELWIRYLQVRAPDLLSSIAATAPTTEVTSQAIAAPTAERWLSEIRGFMLLRWRQSIGGPQLLDGIHMHDLKLGPMLGEGSYGQVFLARHRVLPDRWYAVKRQQLDVAMQTSRRGQQQLRLLEREREVLLLLARESRGKADINLFVQLVTHGQDAACLQLAMTAVLGGELFHLLQETGAMKEAEVQFYAGNLVMALEHLHSRGIAYRDLKSENVLLSGGFTHAAAGWPVLADFGLANWVKNDGASLQTFCGTPAFIAPEVATQNGHGAAADWWSLGVLIFQCLTLCTPFEGPTAHATIENVIHGRRVQARKARALIGELSPNATGIIDALLHPDPAERLGGPLRGNEVRTNPFFWGFDFTQIEKRRMTPPHATRCRERAVAATQHPSLRLPQLPNLDQLSFDAVAASCAVAARPRNFASASKMTTMELDKMERGPSSGSGVVDE